MKMNKILWVMLGLMVMCMSVAFADLTCTDATSYNTSVDYNHVNGSTYEAINQTFSANQTFSEFYNITPKATFQLLINETVTMPALNETVALSFYDINVTSGSVIAVYNGSTLIAKGNYSVINISGTSPRTYYLNYTSNGTALQNYTGNTVTVSYNKTMYLGVENLVDHDSIWDGGALYELNNTPTYNISIGWKFTNNTMNSLNTTLYRGTWTTSWTYINRSCTIGIMTEGCENTKNTTYTAFGIIALLSIIGAAFLLIGMFSNGTDPATLAVTTVMIIGLAIVLMIGFIVIYYVGAAIC